MAEGKIITQIPEDFPFETVSQVGSGMIVTGIFGFFIGLVFRDSGRPVRTGSILVLLVGVVALVAGTLLERQVGIDAAEDAISEQLDALDPVARAQVLKSVAQEQFKPLMGD